MPERSYCHLNCSPALKLIIFIILGILSPVSSLSISEEDNCTVQLTWAAPYTLQGVSVDKYIINITQNGDVLWSNITNDTKYKYNSYSLGEDMGVVVAAVNGAGTGNVSSIEGELLAVYMLL